ISLLCRFEYGVCPFSFLPSLQHNGFNNGYPSAVASGCVCLRTAGKLGHPARIDGGHPSDYFSARSSGIQPHPLTLRTSSLEIILGEVS
ncbi:MAG TPA: hypothetical protein VNY81_03255, partial [Candidatus Saccharimonadales bacterium]|nr:hypothetical protein [Candidatus Saccharimonadales bacterium]